jgi:pimeloyl-ACP methyl ester carboxylesterase
MDSKKIYFCLGFFSGLIALVIVILFEYSYHHRTFLIEMGLLTKNLLHGDVKITLPYPISKVEFENKGLRLVGDLYIPKGQGPFPAIVFIHGENKLGRNLPLYRILCKKFVQLNYVVLNFDLRGFGESQDPDKIESLNDLDFVGDVSSAVNYLLSLDKVNHSNINVVGHSLGAGVALAVASENISEIRKIAVISPGIRTGKNKNRAQGNSLRPEPERILGSKGYNKWYRLGDGMVHIIYPSELEERVFRQLLVGKDLIGNPHHPPILLINGSHEFDLEPDFLNDFYSQITPPKKYVIIEGADHYFGTKFDEISFPYLKRYSENLRLPILFIFEKKTGFLNRLVEEIDSWLKEN